MSQTSSIEIFFISSKIIAFRWFWTSGEQCATLIFTMRTRNGSACTYVVTDLCAVSNKLSTFLNTYAI